MPEVAWTMESGDHPVVVACQPVVPEEAAQILRAAPRDRPHHIESLVTDPEPVDLPCAGHQGVRRSLARGPARQRRDGDGAGTRPLRSEGRAPWLRSPTSMHRPTPAPASVRPRTAPQRPQPRPELRLGQRGDTSSRIRPDEWYLLGDGLAGGLDLGAQRSTSAAAHRRSHHRRSCRRHVGQTGARTSAITPDPQRRNWATALPVSHATSCVTTVCELSAVARWPSSRISWRCTTPHRS